MFTFTPKTEEELYPLLANGEYPFEVMTATQKTTKDGKPMMSLLLKVYSNDQKTFLVYDNLTEAFEFKIKHFCDSVGLEEKYKQGKLSEHDFKGKCGYVKIYIAKDKEGRWKDKNMVADYVKNEQRSVASTMTPPLSKVANDFFNDDITF